MNLQAEIKVSFPYLIPFFGGINSRPRTLETLAPITIWCLHLAPMADDKLSFECLDRLEALIANLIAAQLHSIVILDSIVSKLNAILLKRHISILSSSSINSHHVDEEVPNDTVEELVSMGSSELSSEVPPLPITHGAAQAVWLPSRPVSTSEFSAKLPPLVTKHVVAPVVLSEVFRIDHPHYRHGHDHCNTVPLRQRHLAQRCC